MKLIQKTYVEKGFPVPPPNEIEKVIVELTRDELDIIIRGLKVIHSHAASYCGIAGETPVEDSRIISDLYYALKY